MGLSDRLSKLFGKSAVQSAAQVEDDAKAERMRSVDTGQSAAERDGTRQRMEAELDAQRSKRARPAS